MQRVVLHSDFAEVEANTPAPLAYQLAMSEFLRNTMISCADLAAGEELRHFNALFGDFGQLVDARRVTHWKREHGEWIASCRWSRWGAHPAASAAPELDIQKYLPALSQAITAPIAIDDDFMRRNRVLPFADGLDANLVVVPAMNAGRAECLLVLEGDRDCAWLPEEIQAASDLTEILFKTQQRLIIEAQLAACFYDAPLGITLRSHDGNLIDCNQAFLDFLGRETETELLHQSGIELLASEHVTADMLSALANPAPDGYTGLELPYRHREGGVVWGRISVASIQCDDLWLWLTHIEDVTAARAERTLNAARATRDPVTGLANRHLLIDRLQADLSEEPIDLARPANAVVMFDLNGFKEINDTKGHHAGDEALRKFGERLNSRLRPNDMVSRYGGDEFVVVLGGPLVEEAVTQRADELRRILDEPMVVDDEVIELSAAMGVAVGTPGMSADELLRLADTAMYEDKRRRGAPR